MPQTNKTETKTEKRRLRGIEAAQAALILVIGVVIALVLYFVAIGVVASTPAPNIEVDSFNSILTGNTGKVVLKFGKSGVVKDVKILGNDGNQITGSCQYYNGTALVNPPVNVNAGQEYIFQCTLDTGKTWQSNMIVQVTFADGSIAYVRWVTG
jgi:hypothetical protein